MICSNGPLPGLAMQQKSDPAQPDIVAVGTALAGGPPHRSGRAELPHPALALGNNANAGRRVRMITTFTPILHPRLTYPLKRVEHAHPALCPGHVTLGRFPLGQPPSLHPLLSLRLDLVRRLCRYYGAVRLPMPVHHRRASLDFPMRSGVFSSPDRHRISRFPLKVLTCMHRVSDRAESKSVAISTPPVLPSAYFDSVGTSK